MTSDDVTNLMVFQILTTKIPLQSPISTSMLLNHNIYTHALCNQYLLGDFLCKTIFHHILGRFEPHPPAMEVWIPCLPWNSEIVSVPNFLPWICPIRVLANEKSKRKFDLLLVVVCIVSMYVYDVQITYKLLEI